MSKRIRNKVWEKRYNDTKAWRALVAKGKCPVCTMLLASQYHIRCRYLEKEDKDTPY